jgi:predicted phage terminase large subunit-like protein
MESGEMDGIYREYPIIDEGGKPLWPGKYPTAEHIEQERRKVASNTAWAREYLLKIISTDDQVIRREWIKTYQELPKATFHTYHAISVDLALSLSSRADYTAMVAALICGSGENLRIYILSNPVNERMTSLETIERIKMVVTPLGHSTKIFIEDVQYQGSLVEHLRRANFKAIGVKVHQDKYSRIAAVSFLVEDGKVLFPEKPDKNIEALINQLIGFGVEKHDDLTDAFSMLLSQVIENDRRRGGAWPAFPEDDSDLNNMSSREKFEEIERRQKIRENQRRFFRI